MSPELSGFLTVMLFAATAAAAVGLTIRRSGEPWKTWILIVIAKTYSGLFFRLRVEQSHPIPEGGALILVNHRSPVDPLLVVAVSAGDPFRERLTLVEFLTASEYIRIPGAIGFICKHMRTIPVDRDGQDMESVKIALRRIQDGATVGIFPEGRINFGEGLLPPNPGVAWLALKAERPVIPVFVHGAPQSTTKSMVAPFWTRTRVTVHFGPPVDLSEWQRQRPTPALLSEISSVLMTKLAEAGGLPTGRLKVVHPEDRASA